MGLWQQLRGGCSTLGWCTVASTGSCGWLRQRNRVGMSATFLLVPRQGVIRINIFKELLCNLSSLSCCHNTSTKAQCMQNCNAVDETKNTIIQLFSIGHIMRHTNRIRYLLEE